MADAKPHVDVNDLLANALEDALGFRPEREYVFTNQRLWRVDICFVNERLAIEVDGRSHFRAKRHREDCEKANALAEEGYRVLRFPASSVLTKKRLPWIVDQVKRILCGVCSPGDYSHVLVGD